MKVEVYYQYFEETWWMTFARELHVRRFVGLHRLYSDLSTGQPYATSRFHIGQNPKGLKEGLIVVGSGKQSLVHQQRNGPNSK